MANSEYYIEQFMRRDVLTASPGTPTMEALRLMAQKRVGSIVVVRGDRPVGIFTERDLIYKVVLEGKDPEKTPVGQVMTPRVVTISPNKTIDEALNKMAHFSFRHLLVVDPAKKLLGIISIRDLGQFRQQILELEVDKKTRELTDVRDKLSETLALIKKEMAAAGKFQSQLIERRQPSFKNIRISHEYKQTDAIGGDYFGVSRIGAEHAGILVVDVMGHGVTSAMIAIEIKMYYDMLSNRILDPGVLITQMNRIISTLMPPGFFVAGCYAVLNLKTLHLRYTHFGLPKPGLLRGRDKSYELLQPCQVPLGIKSNTEYPEKDIFIRPGDKLLFFTDGCVEQKNDKGKLLGDRRFVAQFKKLAAAHRPRIPRELYRFVLDYSNHGQITDDIAILLVEFNNTKKPA